MSRSSILEARRELFCGRAGASSIVGVVVVDCCEEIITSSLIFRCGSGSVSEGSGSFESGSDSICDAGSVVLISGMEVVRSLAVRCSSTRDIDTILDSLTTNPQSKGGW